MAARSLCGLGVGAQQDFFQFGVDAIFFPTELGQVLRPLEIRNYDTAGIGQNIGQRRNAALFENRCAARRCGYDPSCLLLSPE